MLSFIRWFVFLFILFAVLAAGAGGLYTWSQTRSTEKYTTAKVTRGDVEVVVNSTGTVKPVRSVSIGAFVSGPIAEIFVDYNSVVKKGDLLARIDPRLTQAAVDRDKATLATQRAEVARVTALLQQALNNEERAKKLSAVNKDYISENEMDQLVFTRKSLQAQLQVAEAAVRQAEASLSNSEANLEFTKIISPVDGIVIERKVDPGQTMAAAFQTPEMFIVAPDLEKKMHVYATVDEADIGLIRKAKDQGQIVRFTVDAYPEELFEGTVYQIRKSSTTTQNVVTYPVLIETTNPDLKLFPGMTANISFQIDIRKNVLRIPTLALRFVPLPSQVREEDRSRVESKANGEDNKRLSAAEKAAAAKARRERLVWVKTDAGLKAVPVKLGLMDANYAELLEGEMSEGDLLVTGLENPAIRTSR